ncbi:hypothetical protein [Buttiauxella sp. A111]|uniref:hypothetical protein n=1 Tax=Buttiauxella sp. A111 TaxID=2563088 RepID=UPI0010CFC6BA|nr:hypothetical protein [Buttiauxella sp. A111]GDX05717.1 hypothetical protein BSPA111_19180 [Buttiauxella sp. A111]
MSKEVILIYTNETTEKVFAANNLTEWKFTLKDVFPKEDVQRPIEMYQSKDTVRFFARESEVISNTWVERVMSSL